MTSVKRIISFSLPKTQPTKNSSTNNHSFSVNIRSQATEQSPFYEITNCPEISQFNISDNSLYTHKLNIDYGRLEEPSSWKLTYMHKAKDIDQPLLLDEIPQETERNRANMASPKNQSQVTAVKSKSMIRLSKKEEVHPQIHSIDDLRNGSHQSTHRNDENDKEKTMRIAQYCRIVRSYVGGGKMQIKIINYPDCSQYRRLCGSFK